MVLLLVACATPAPDEKVHLGPVGPELALKIAHYQPPKKMHEVTQLVVAHYGDKTLTFETHISINAERLLLVGMDPLGRRALTIRWDTEGVTYTKEPWVPTDLHPENILADIILLYWPEPFVRQWLQAHGATLTSTKTSRAVRMNGQEIIHIDYQPGVTAAWNGRAHYEHRVWGYRLDIQSSEQH